MVSPTDRHIGQPVNGSADDDQMSPHSTASDDTEATSSSTIAALVTGRELQRLLHVKCLIDHNDELLVGADGQLCLGRVCASAQRRSVTQDLALVANGLKPVKGSVNKFSVNKISEGEPNNVWSAAESVIEFTKCLQSTDDYPISCQTNVVATGPHSHCFIKDDHGITRIRPNDGFVMVESNLLVLDLDGHHLYGRGTKGHLFLLGRSNHLLVIDRSSDRKQTTLIVGSGGLSIHSLSQNNFSGHKCSDSYEDRPIRLVGSAFRLTNTTTPNGKRRLEEPQQELESKRRLCSHSAANGRLVDS